MTAARFEVEQICLMMRINHGVEISEEKKLICLREILEKKYDVEFPSHTIPQSSSQPQTTLNHPSPPSQQSAQPFVATTNLSKKEFKKRKEREDREEGMLKMLTWTGSENREKVLKEKEGERKRIKREEKEKDKEEKVVVVDSKSRLEESKRIVKENKKKLWKQKKKTEVLEALLFKN